jgi:hypothetical protein
MDFEGDEHESSVVCIQSLPHDPTGQTESACRQIIDAASALTVDLEFIASAPPGEAREASLEDARRSVERIVKLVQLIKHTPIRRARTA